MTFREGPAAQSRMCLVFLAPGAHHIQDGFELGRESVLKIIAPEPVEFSVAMIVVLVLSILVKFWMSRFTSNIGRRIHSSTMSAATSDAPLCWYSCT